MIWMLMCFAALTCLAWMSRGLLWRKCLVLSAFGLVVTAYWLINRFSGAGITDAVIYHLHTNLEGTGFSDFKEHYFRGSVLLVGLIAVGWMPWVLRHRRPARRVAGWIFYVAALVALLSSALVWDIVQVYRAGRVVSEDGVIEQYAVPRRIAKQQKNVVILYLESVERTYLDEARFPGLMPNLHRLSRQALDFTDVRSLPGSGWTVGGIVGSQCGIPLTALGTSVGELNNMGDAKSFLPGATCMGDLLARDGYGMEFIGGASAAFGGKGSFLAGHGFKTVRDHHDFAAAGISPADFSGWGVHDDVLLSYVLDRYKVLVQEKTPFVLATLTLDTHSPSGHVLSKCKDIDYRGLGDSAPLLNALQCTDRLVGDFVDRLRASPGWKDTILIIASDHVSLPNDLQSQLGDAASRRNLLLVLGDEVKPRSVGAKGSTLDTGPTLLQLLGYEGRLGFGRSLLTGYRDGMTAASVAGRDLRPYQQFSSRLWQLGSLRDGFVIKDNKLHAGSQEYSLPEAIVVDKDQSITALNPAGIRYVPAKTDLAPGQKLVYIERCLAFGRTQDGAQWCVWYQDGEQRPRLIGPEALRDAEGLQPLLAQAQPAIESSEFEKTFLIVDRFSSEQSTEVGFVRAGSLYSQGRAGTLMYGPYQDLCPGTYRYTLTGEMLASPHSLPTTDVASEVGRYVHLQGELVDRPHTGTLYTGELTLGAPALQVEARVSVSEEASLRLDGYRLEPVYPLLPVGSPVDFTNVGIGERFLGCGWDTSESSGRWTIASLAHLRGTVAPSALAKELRLKMVAGGYLRSGNGVQPVDVMVGSEKIAHWDVVPDYKAYETVIPSRLVAEDGRLDIKLRMSEASRPCKQQQNTTDCRELGLSLRQLQLDALH